MLDSRGVVAGNARVRGRVEPASMLSSSSCCSFLLSTAASSASSAIVASELFPTSQPNPRLTLPNMPSEPPTDFRLSRLFVCLEPTSPLSPDSRAAKVWDEESRLSVGLAYGDPDAVVADPVCPEGVP